MNAFHRAKLFKQPNINILTWGQFAVMQLAKTQGTFSGSQALVAVRKYQDGADEDCVQAVVELLVETKMIIHSRDAQADWRNQLYQLNF